MASWLIAFPEVDSHPLKKLIMQYIYLHMFFFQLMFCNCSPAVNFDIIWKLLTTAQWVVVKM